MVFVLNQGPYSAAVCAAPDGTSNVVVSYEGANGTQYRCAEATLPSQAAGLRRAQALLDRFKGYHAQTGRHWPEVKEERKAERTQLAAEVRRLKDAASLARKQAQDYLLQAAALQAKIASSELENVYMENHHA